jgi:deazaflavin-dependent oxidoreductase (nitroreductase family)
MLSDHAYARFSMSMPAGMLRALGRVNVPIYRLTRGRLLGKIGKAPVLLLTSTGRRSGEPRTTPVLYLEDDGRYVVIGSNAGNASTPAWAHNLKANPTAEVQVGSRRIAVHARVAEGHERAALWRKANEQYGGFEDYEARTSRDISVFVLEPR